MSQKVVTTCDHCSKECDGDQYASIGRWEEPKAITFGKTIHGCTKEHLGFALAKAFGIGVDGQCAVIIHEKGLEISDRDKRIEEARQAHAMLERDANEKQASAHAYIVSLEKQLAAANANLTSITEQTKPTKPLTGHPACAECGQQKSPIGCWCDQRSK